MKAIKRMTLTALFLFTVAVIFTSCKKDPPVASFTTSIDGLTVTFTSTSTGTVESLTWDFGDDETGTGETATHTYEAAGDYTVTLTAEGKKEDDVATQTVTVGSAGAATDPSPEFNGADGVLVAVKTSNWTDAPGVGPIETVIGTAVASFPSGVTFVDAGTVSCESKSLTKNANNTYSYIPDILDVTGISFSDNVHWEVSGANGIPTIDFTTDSIAFPAAGMINSSSTVDLSTSYTLSSDGVTGADSILFILTDYSGNQAMATEAAGTDSHTFSSADLSNLSAGGGIAQIAAYSFQNRDESGKSVFYVNEAVTTDVMFTFK